ncbi:MAG: hypothetical protein WB662_18515, partial [Methyloceanibacter sp.]
MISHFTVGLRAKGKADRVAVDAEDALIAALKVKAERPDATITYVRRQNRRGDARHPANSLAARNDKENGGDFPLALPATAHAHAVHDD